MSYPTPNVAQIKRFNPGQPVTVLITPDLANQLLGLCDRNYRYLRSSWVQQYARQMSIGKWEMNFSANIVICRNGDGQLHLMDGQHRMAAVAESKVACNFMLVLVDDPDYHDEVVDVNKVRSALDDFRKHGIIDHRVAPVARLLLIQEGIRKEFVTRDMIMEGYFQYQEAIDSMLKHAPSKTFGWRAGLNAAIVRAWFRYDEEIISNFCRKVVSVEFSGPEEAGAKYVYMNIQDGATSRGFPQDFDFRCEAGFYYFAEGKHAMPRKGRGLSQRPHIRAVKVAGYHLPIPPFHYPGIEIGKRGTREKKNARFGKDSLFKDLVGALRNHPRTPFSAAELIKAVGKRKVQVVTQSIMLAYNQGRLPDDIVVLEKGNMNWYICDPL